MKNVSGCRLSHDAIRSSASPYEAAVSMWLTPCSSSRSRVRSASACETLATAAAPKIVRVLSWPVRPNGCLAITTPSVPSAVASGTPVADTDARPMEQRLSLVTLGVADVGRARAFYGALGWRPGGGVEDETDQVVFFQ